MHNAAGQSSAHRTWAHLLAAHYRATPKQAKEPIFSKRDKVMTNKSVILTYQSYKSGFAQAHNRGGKYEGYHFSIRNFAHQI
ncbi:MAG: hypothetical protein ACKO96_44790 [Flammeovirgaceae bacterium]